MSCDACLKPCERSGLLAFMNPPSVHEPYSTTRPPQRRGGICNWPCMCVLLAIAATTVLVIFAPFSDKTKMTPERQVELLNSETKHAHVVTSGCETTLILMRHCEYTDANGESEQDEMGNKHCSRLGLERAKYFATLFGDENESSAIWPLPSYLYAMSRDPQDSVGRSINNREIETLAPLRYKSGVEIDKLYSEGGERHVALDYFKHLSSGDLCRDSQASSTVVIWRDKRIPSMAKALGCGPKEGCPEKYKRSEFDKVWQLTYTYWTEGSGRGMRRKKKNRSDSREPVLVEGWNVRGKVVKERFVPPE